MNIIMEIGKNMKRIWLVNPYGTIAGENWREYSFNQFGKYLSNHGYQVIWWTSSFAHHFKRQRSNGWKDIRVTPGFIIRLVPTTGYKKNFGVGRMWKDHEFAKNALIGFKKEIIPDLIIANENPLNMGKPAFIYAKRHNVPIIYDQMDIWPEFIVKNLRSPLNKVAEVILKPVYRRRKYIYNHLDGSIALGKHYLEFMQTIATSLSTKPNALVYNGIDVNEFRSHLTEEISDTNLLCKIPVKTEGEIWCVFAGTLGPSYDVQNIIKCAEKLSTENQNFKFIIAGSGPLENEVREAEKKISNLVYVGKLLPEQLIPIYGRCDIGLATYSAASNVDMPDKFYDYTAAGLAVLNSLKGEISEWIRNNQVGLNYTPGRLNELEKALCAFEDSEYLEDTKRRSLDLGTQFDMNKQNGKLLEVVSRLLL